LASASERVSVPLAGVTPGGVRMTITEAILLAISVAVFVYLGIAMFKPDWF
jgi:hypothetical protein